MVKSGLDPHMINELKNGLNLLSDYFLALLSTNHKFTHSYLHCSEENPGEEYFGGYEEF
jgi:hypothetical protein